jgi:prepilin-type N-terminal cleavage/methylation domain-containing protein
MNNRGFSLIELLLVVAIVAVLGAGSASFYSRFIVQNDVAVTRDQLVAALRKAQTYSMVGKRASPWGVHYTTGTITLYQGPSFALRNSAVDEKISVRSTILLSGLTEINFARMSGIPSAMPTITISGNADTKSVTVNAVGAISR